MHRIDESVTVQDGLFRIGAFKFVVGLIEEINELIVVFGIFELIVVEGIKDEFNDD